MRHLTKFVAMAVLFGILTALGFAVVQGSDQFRSHPLKLNVAFPYGSAATAVTLVSGQGSQLPAPGSNYVQPFLAFWYDSRFNSYAQDPNAEAVLVTAVKGDVLTVTRAQAGTPASNHSTAGRSYLMYVQGYTITIKDGDYSIFSPVFPNMVILGVLNPAGTPVPVRVDANNVPYVNTSAAPTLTPTPTFTPTFTPTVTFTPTNTPTPTFTPTPTPT